MNTRYAIAFALTFAAGIALGHVHNARADKTESATKEYKAVKVSNVKSQVGIANKLNENAAEGWRYVGSIHAAMIMERDK